MGVDVLEARRELASQFESAEQRWLARTGNVWWRHGGRKSLWCSPRGQEATGRSRPLVFRAPQLRAQAPCRTAPVSDAMVKAVDRWRHPPVPAVFALLAVLLAASCGAAPAPSAAPTAPTVLPTTTETENLQFGEESGAPEPTLEFPILEDPAFREASTRSCSATRPANAFELDGPSLPAAKMPAFDRVHIVVLEMRDSDGAIGPPPPLPPGEAYYPASGLASTGGYSEALSVEADYASQVDLLACVELRAGASKSYSGESGEVRVTALDAIVWMVDVGSGATTGEPWVVPADLSFTIDTSSLISAGRAKLLPADVRTAIAYFMGRALPMGGVVYQGGGSGWVVAEYDVPPDLPEGTALLEGNTFVVRLVVLGDQGGMIDFIDLLCAPYGTVSGPPLRVASDVVHHAGTFAATSADVKLDGDFLSDTLATGRLGALSSRAAACGVPASTAWQAALAASARPDDGGYVVFLP